MLGGSADRRIGGSAARIGFVSTNSITQGEQVAQLWPILFDRHGLEIAFAHRTFAWGSDARGKAHVHVVVIGLTHRDHEPREKRLFSYDDVGGEPHESRHAALTPYLFDAGTVANRHLVVRYENEPLAAPHRLVTGSKPLDGGYLIVDASDRDVPADDRRALEADHLLRPFIGAVEFINGSARQILRLADADPIRLQASPFARSRLRATREFRSGDRPAKKRQDSNNFKLGSSSNSLADQPARYHVNVVPDRPFLVIPQVSSERREYVPIGWLQPPAVPSDKLRVLLDASLYDFAVLTSRMHMAWMRAITGRMKSDYMYSVGVVYNTFPWPDATSTQRAAVESLAQAVLDAREAWPMASLADLYDPDTMPANLRRAHAELDRAVDRLYRREPFASDRDRVEHLFGRYEALVNPLGHEAVRQNKRVARRSRVTGHGGGGAA